MATLAELQACQHTIETAIQHRVGPLIIILSTKSYMCSSQTLMLTSLTYVDVV